MIDQIKENFRVLAWISLGSNLGLIGFVLLIGFLLGVLSLVIQKRLVDLSLLVVFVVAVESTCAMEGPESFRTQVEQDAACDSVADVTTLLEGT